MHFGSTVPARQGNKPRNAVFNYCKAVQDKERKLGGEDGDEACPYKKEEIRQAQAR